MESFGMAQTNVRWSFIREQMKAAVVAIFTTVERNPRLTFLLRQLRACSPDDLGSFKKITTNRGPLSPAKRQQYVEEVDFS